MAQFASDTRRWLEAAIKQRKLILRMNKCHKPVAEVLTALELLEKMLNAYFYSNDLFMARFICQYRDQVEIILPGEGSTSCRKKQLEFNDIHYNAVLIINAQGTELRAKGKTKTYVHETFF